MTETHDAWHLKGSVVVACNCDYGCPCNFNGLPTTGSCEGGWTWHVDDGHHEDVDLSGLNFTLLCKWPGAIHEGNGEAVCMIDERASDAQRSLIQRFLRGEIGGPWAILINTYALHDPDFVPYSVTIDNERSTVKAGDIFDVATEPVRNPVTGVEVASSRDPAGRVHFQGRGTAAHFPPPGRQRDRLRPRRPVRGGRPLCLPACVANRNRFDFAYEGGGHGRERWSKVVDPGRVFRELQLHGRLSVHLLQSAAVRIDAN